MVGPFFYIRSKALQYRGFLYHTDDDKNAERYGSFLTSKVGHAELFDKRFSHAQIEYFDFPRGRVVFDVENDRHIIYIDKCIKAKVDVIARLFKAENYFVDKDEHYVCKNCIGSVSCD